MQQRQPQLLWVDAHMNKLQLLALALAGEVAQARALSNTPRFTP